MKHWVTCCLCTVVVFAMNAQQKNYTIETSAEIIWAGVDRPGDLTVLLETGEVQKYSKEGKRIGAHIFKHKPVLLEPLDGVQAFYYSREGNTYGKLSSDLRNVSEHTIDPAFAISPWLACPSLHELWILDSADFSIRKTKLNSTSISLESALRHLPQKRIEDYTYMREYQNYLFLLDANAGIHVFNSLGKYVRTLGEKGLEYFNFLGEEMYFLKNGQLIFIDLYSQEKRSVAVTLCRFAFVTDETQYLIKDNRVSILPFKPE